MHRRLTLSALLPGCHFSVAVFVLLGVSCHADGSDGHTDLDVSEPDGGQDLARFDADVVDAGGEELVPVACVDGWRQIEVVRTDALPQRANRRAPRRRLQAPTANLPPFRLLGDGVRRVVGTEEVQGFELQDEQAVYSGLTGAGVRVLVADSGVDYHHPDFQADGQTRVSGDQPGAGLLDETHGTRVAGVLAGNGAASAGMTVADRERAPFELRGHAPEVAEIISVRLDGTIDVEAFARQPAHVLNHSHSFSNGTYDERVAQYDEVIAFGYLGPPRAVVVAAGNNGVDPAPPFFETRGYYSVLGPLKNAIVVGSVNANDLVYAPQSSIGPTFDGRIKPDLVAPGHRDFRPLQGVPVTIDEVRLQATAAEPDLVWGSAGADWEQAGDFADLEPSVEVVTRGGLDHWLQIAPPGGIDTSQFDSLSFTMRIAVDVQDTEHRHPPWFVVQFDLDDDGSFESGFYPRFDPDKQTSEVHEHSVSFAELDAWTGTVGGVRLVPVIYDDRVYAPAPGGGYAGVRGTSYAAPVVSGAAALLLQQFAEQHGVDIDSRPPLPSTVKALLIHTAHDLVHPTPATRDRPNPDTGAPVTYFEGPDFATGFGLVDVAAATGLLGNHSVSSPRFVEEAIADGEQHRYRIFVDATAPLVVTLAWDDRPGDPELDVTDAQLVNDLDVVAVADGGAAHSPWILDPPPLGDPPEEGLDPIAETPRARQCVTDEPFADATCVDRRNNVEKIEVGEPDAGPWEVVVRAGAVADDQPYSLVISQRCR